MEKKEKLFLTFFYLKLFFFLFCSENHYSCVYIVNKMREIELNWIYIWFLLKLFGIIIYYLILLLEFIWDVWWPHQANFLLFSLKGFRNEKHWERREIWKLSQISWFLSSSLCLRIIKDHKSQSPYWSFLFF